MKVGNKIVAILGRRGAGKTLLGVHYCKAYQLMGRVIYSNIWLDFPHEKLYLKDIEELPDKLNNSIVFIDEIQMWADAYNFLSKGSRAIATIATQLRKRNITFIFTTQFLKQSVVRLRDQVDYTLLLSKYKVDGVANVEVLDATAPAGEDFIGEFIFDGRRYFNMYNTNEVVLPE